MFATSCSENSEPAAQIEEASKKIAPLATEALTESAEAPFVTTPWETLDDPTNDGWESEVWSARTNAQIKRLLGWATQESSVTEQESLEALLDSDFRSTSLRPDAPPVLFEDPSWKVIRWVASDSDREAPDAEHRGFDGLRRALTQMLPTPLGTADEASRERRVSSKGIRIEMDSNTLRTSHLITTVTALTDQWVEQHATWVVDWTFTHHTKNEDSDPPPPLMRKLRLVSFEETTRKHRDTLFTDCTPTVLSGNASYAQQLLLGFNHWLERGQDLRFLYLLGNPGIAIGDANGDGRDDLYLCQESDLPNRLYLQNADGTVSDHSSQAGVDWLENSRCALFADFDNDGDQDLAVGIDGGVVMARNQGQGSFESLRVLPSNDDVVSLSAADANNDGFLDLYAGVYHRNTNSDASDTASIPAASGNTVYHDANNGGGNTLFLNRGSEGASLEFKDATTEVGLQQNNQRFTLAASWEDYDNDGDQDLYVANDFGRNNLYRNDHVPTGTLRFTDVASLAGVEDSASGMGVTWGDYDRDGKMDLHVSNMFSAAGNRIAFQDQFKPDAPSDVKTRLQRFARGNTLFHNSDSTAFHDDSDLEGITMGRWAWSS